LNAKRLKTLPEHRQHITELVELLEWLAKVYRQLISAIEEMESDAVRDWSKLDE